MNKIHRIKPRNPVRCELRRRGSLLGTPGAESWAFQRRGPEIGPGAGRRGGSRRRKVAGGSGGCGRSGRSGGRGRPAPVAAGAALENHRCPT